MKEYITENSAAIAAGGLKATAVGASTAVICGFALNPAEIQLIGVVIGAFGVIVGLIITALAKWFERKDRLASMKWSGEERRSHGRVAKRNS